MNQPTIPPPHPNPHRPARLTTPRGACDAHCHVFGPGHRFPYAPTRSYTPHDAGLAALRAVHDRLGLTRAVVVQASCHGTDNRAMVDALQQGAGRYAGVAMIDANTSDDELEALHRVGVRGIRFNFVAHLGGAPDQTEFWRSVERIAPLGWHVVLHFDAKDITEHWDLFDRMPVPFVIDHFARVSTSEGLKQAPFRALLQLLTDERCWVKVSGAERLGPTGHPPYDEVVPFAQELIRVAPDRILWGTDWPHPNVRVMPDDGDLVDLLADFAPDPELRHRILVDNPARLYDFNDQHESENT